MEVSFTTLPREKSLSILPMATTNLNQILPTARISLAGFSHTSMPTFASITQAQAKGMPASQSRLDQPDRFPKLKKFPFHEGKEVEEITKEMIKVKDEPKIRYLDVEKGSGDRVTDQRQKVRIHFDFYDSNQNLIHGNWQNGQKRRPEKIKLCKHKLGKGFEKGIQGMQEGGIRRIVVPPEYSYEDVEGYGVFDVELLEVRPSKSCKVRKIFFK
ncbi:hypothetical protein P3X46_011972 [Hevea brasiliensis]|uniref:peptidylprolyl isomerase n=1 Tax=Hevea brasiliensis TaxID=3981 RepID=A0ABQ9M8S5_HEVBR|nr:peptidyl-prolyl cis-trans isomerase FKBP20-2, chloroplastic [Hevea brasiliensis]KAJ9176686.1 hypothetical protein P3X46_011972 [Hevea brasiliensis]